MHKVALVINIDKPLAVASAREIIAWLEARGVQPQLLPDSAAVVGRSDLATPGPNGWADADMAFVLGGDGTLIRGAQLLAPLGVPILGINTGHLGFLTELENVEVFDHLEEIAVGEFTLEERMMLTARVFRDGECLLEVSALNDAVVSKGPRARLVHLQIGVGETSVARYRADGVVVATPTGSTAYSLSAGGPIVAPTVDVLVVTSICPHTVSSRSMVVAGTESVTVRVVESPGEVGLSADGSDPFPLLRGDVVRVSRAPHLARLVRRRSYRFYDVLRQKLPEPER